MIELCTFLVSLTLSLCVPFSSSPCSSGSSLWSSSCPASVRPSPPLTSQLLDCVSRRLHPARPSNPAQGPRSQTPASSQQVISWQRRRTASWAAGQQSLWRRCEHWALFVAVVWTAQTAACWSSTSRRCSRGRRRLRRASVIEQKPHSPPHQHHQAKQHSPPPRRLQTTNQ